MHNPSWKLIKRKNVYTSKFVKVYEDEIELPNGTRIDDYTIIEKKDIVMIVATDREGNIIVLDEYKYAIDAVIPTLPAGGLKKDEDPITCALRELKEETGYEFGKAELITTLHDYPTKDLHKVYVVRVKNAKKLSQQNHEATEQITWRLLDKDSLKKEVLSGAWKGTSSVAALAVCGLI